MKIKILSAWSLPGGSTIANINLCNLFNASGYDCTFYGPHEWQEHHCKGASLEDVKIESGDVIISHFLEMGERPKTAHKVVLSCHETNVFPIKGKKKFWDNIHFVSESQKEWQGVDGVVIPNVISPLENNGGRKGYAGVIGSIDPHKQTHLSIKRALLAGYKKVLVHGLITDQRYYIKHIKPLEKNKKVVLAESYYITGEERGNGVYTKEEQKCFDPEVHGFYKDKLIESFQFKKKNYFKGVSGRVDVGEKDFNWQLDLHGNTDEDHLTFSNVFINNNYPRFIKEIVPFLSNRKVIFVVNEAADVSGLPFDVEKTFRIGSNCMIKNFDMVETICEYIKKNNIKDHIILCSAASLSNYIIHKAYETCDENTYMDIGSSLSPYMNLEGWKYSRGYLQHHWLGMANQYGTKVDIW